MARRRHTPDQVINKRGEAGVAKAGDSPVAETARRIGVTGQTFYRRRSDCGGTRIDQAGRPNRAAADLTRDNRILREASGKLLSPSRRRRCVNSVYNAAIGQPARGRDDAPTSCLDNTGLEQSSLLLWPRNSICFVL